MNIFLTTLKALKFPLKLLVRKKPKKRTELERKCYRHVRLNTPSNVSYQKSIGKYKKKQKKNRKFSRKKTNNFSKDRNY